MTPLADGLLLMLIGMGTVLLFLIAMSAWISLSSKILARLPELASEPGPRETRAVVAVEEQEPDQHVLLAVISAAIERYRSDRR